MKESKIVRYAKAMKEKGYTHMRSVLKSHMSSTYYHIVNIDDIIKAGKWIPCTNYHLIGWHGKVGRTYNQLKKDGYDMKKVCDKSYCRYFK
jgi:hypothetical protein